MKKLSVLSLAVSAIFLVNCSDDSLKRPDYVPGNSEFEITLSTSTLATRDAIEGDGDISGMGVYCLASAYQNGESSSINWATTSAEDPSCLLDNVKANKIGGSVNWDDTSAKYYYPVFQLYKYYFASYYPYSESATKTNSNIGVDYTIDGNTDIIWGEAKSDEALAYSASYYREADNPQDPKLTLHHMLTRLSFIINQAEAYEGEEATNMTLDAVKVTDTKGGCHLVIADSSNPELDKRLTSDSENTVISLSAANLPCQVVAKSGENQNITLGTGLMLYPQDSYNIELTTTTTPASVAGEEVTPETTTVSVPLKLSSGTFEAGNAYKINVLINGPRRITLNAELIPWNEVDGPSIKL